MTLAESINAGTLSSLMDPSELRPGFWNLVTTNLIVSGVSDLLGQLVVGYLADQKGRHYAMNVNASSVFMASIFTLFGLFSNDKWAILAAVAAPLLKWFGGGAHTSAFLTLVLLRSQANIGVRSAYYCATGAVIVLAQSLGSWHL